MMSPALGAARHPRLPNSSYLVLQVEGNPEVEFPDEIDVDGERVRLEVKREFKVPVPTKVAVPAPTAH